MTASAQPPVSTVSVWEWTQTALLAVNLVWTTLCLGGARAETQVVTLALTTALVAAHFLARVFARNDAARSRVHPAGWLLLPFLIYAAANVIGVTPVRWLGWLDWIGWAQLVAVFWVTLNGIGSRAPRWSIFFTLVVLGLAGVVLASYQRFVRPDWIMLGRVWPGDLGGRASGSFGIPNSFAGFLLLILPAVAALAFRRSASVTARVWWGWVAVVLLLGLLLTISRGAWMALAIALIVWPLAAARGGWWRRVKIAAIVVGAMGVVGALVYWKSPKARARFTSLVMDAGERTRPIMWRGAWRLFREHPALGAGAGSYSVLFERHRPERFPDEPLWAHNEYLNTLSDYGAVGFVLFFGAAGVMAVRCLRGPREEKSRRNHALDSPTVVAALGVGLLAFALQMALDFHLKLPALAMEFAVIGALAVRRAWPGAPVTQVVERSRGFGRAANALVSVGCVVGVGFLFLPMLRAESHRQRGRLAIDRSVVAQTDATEARQILTRARDEFVRATELDPRNAKAWSELSYATALLSRDAPAHTVEQGRVAETAADRALLLSGACTEFWLRRGVARDMQGRWVEAGEDFFKAIDLAPNNAFVWYYSAEHLFRVKGTREPAEAALAFCLRLDPGNPSGLALRQRLAIKAKGP